MFTYDPGFMSTASCQSTITYIDGDKGELLYRGYPIEQLATNCDFLETCYLLLYGELPDAGAEGQVRLHRHATTPWCNEQMQFFLRGFRRDAHPMAVMTGLVGALSAFYHDSLDINNPRAPRDLGDPPDREDADDRGDGLQVHHGPAVHVPEERPLATPRNFMRMMFATPCEEYEPNDVLERALDRIFILHADHEQNASTSTVRLCGSSGANPFAASPRASPACGARRTAAPTRPRCNMLDEIQKAGRRREDRRVRRRRSRTRTRACKLMGFGHRVYKNYDPRAKLMQETCHEVLDELGLHDDPLFKLAMALEKIALEDDYFVSRKLYPNVDFYSGIVQSAHRHPDLDVHRASSRSPAPWAGSRSGTR